MSRKQISVAALLGWVVNAVMALRAEATQGGYTLSFQGPRDLYGAPGETKTVSYYLAASSGGGAPPIAEWRLGVSVTGGHIVRVGVEGTDFEARRSQSSDWSILSNSIIRGSGSDGAIVICSGNGFHSNEEVTLDRIDVSVVFSSSCSTLSLFVDPNLPDPFRGGDIGVSLGNAAQENVSSTRYPADITLHPTGTGCASVRDVNPHGWIEASGWNILFPLTQSFGCDGGGSFNLMRNWVAPHNVVFDSPVAGTTWDIDLGGAALATGYAAPELSRMLGGDGRPKWISNDALEPHFGRPPESDAVDYVALWSFLRANLSGSFLRAPEDMVAAAQTYVENTRPFPITVQLCVASDDSVQVRLDDELVLNHSVCRGLDPGCADLTDPLKITPGLHKITVLTWQGAGGWSFRLGLADPTAGIRWKDLTDTGLVFRGTNGTGYVLEPRLQVRRSVHNDPGGPFGLGTVHVILKGFLGDDNGEGEVVKVIEEHCVAEEHRGPQAELLARSLLDSGGGLVSFNPDLGLFRIEWTVQRSALVSTGIHYDLAADPRLDVTMQGTVDGALIVDGDDRIQCLAPHTGPIGVFDDSHDVGRAAALASGPGSLAMNPGPDGKAGTADDVYTMTGSGSDVWNEGDSFHFAYKRVKGDFTAAVRIRGREFPASGGRWGRHGLMARLDCSPNSKYSFVHANLEATAPGLDHPQGDAVFYQFRRFHGTDGGNDNRQAFVFPDPDGAGPKLVNQPDYFLLERRGQTLTGYASFDGKAWKLVGSDTWRGLEGEAELLVGFAYSRHSSATTAGKITFSDFSVKPLPPPAPVAVDPSASGTVLIQEDFSHGLPSNLQINVGSGSFTPKVVNGRLRLSQDGLPSSATSAFFKVPIDVTKGRVAIRYRLRAVKPGLNGPLEQGLDPNPADGFAMVLAAGTSTSRVGQGGGGLGYEGITRSFADGAPSFAVEHDTWNGSANGVGYNEGLGSPANDGAWHLGIDWGGNIDSVKITDGDLPELFQSSTNPNGAVFEVTYDASGGVSVWEIPEDLTRSSRLLAQGFVGSLVSRGGSEAVLGFTTATGDATQTMEVDDVLVKTLQDCTDPPEVVRATGPSEAIVGEPFVLNACGSEAGGGEDRPLNFLWELLAGPGEIIDVLGRCKALVRGTGTGVLHIRVTVDDLVCQNPASFIFEIPVHDAPQAPNWKAADTNGDGSVDISDAVATLNFLFAGGRSLPCEAASDFNGDGGLDISDAIATLSFLFSGGSPPARGLECAEFPACGSAGGECG